jgi:large subunit ribosomal protein L5
MNYINPMQKPKIDKVTLNIGVGQSGEKLVKAESLLSKLTSRKPVRTISKHKIPAWGLKKGDAIGCKVTLRGKNAEEFLKRAFIAKNNQIKENCFDQRGNFSFGIHEYIDIPGIKYDPDIGIMGMDVTVTVARPGYRIKKRMLRPAKIKEKDFIKKEETIDLVKEKFSIEVVGEE